MTREGPPEPVSRAFPPARRIRRRPEFLRVYEQGQRVRGRLMTVMAASNDLGHSRLGIAATRKVGSAVVRNRAKRLVRELFRLSDVPAGLDIVVIPRSDMVDAEFPTVESEFRWALRRLGPRR